MDLLFNMFDELMILEKLMRNDIEYLRTEIRDNHELIALIRNHHNHLEMILLRYLKITKERCENYSREI